MATSLAGRLGASFSKRLLLRSSGVAAPNAAALRVVTVRCFTTDDDSSEKKPYTQEYFQGLVRNKPIVVFMKGDPSAPMCGFSRLVVQILHMHGLNKYDHYNVLEDVDFKEGMKAFSDWPTFPQVYMNSELMGGADIMLQMHQSGELVKELEKIGHKSALLETEQAKDT